MSDQHSKATPELQRHIGKLFEQGLKVSNPLAQLHQIREKINARGFQNFDKDDIMGELGQLQRILGELHGEMLRIDSLLNKGGK